MRKFFQTPRYHKLRISICTVIIILIVFLAYIRIGVGDLVAHNASDTSMIGIEMLCESGPNFKLAVKQNIKMLEKYTTHMENKYLGSILRVLFLYEEYTPKKGFEEALKTLKEAKDSSQEECARAIWLAGEQVEQYRMKAASFLILNSRFHKYQKVPEKLVEDIKKARNQSKKSFERFKENPTLENAVFLCEDNRWTMLLLFLARAGYNSNHEGIFDEFRTFHELEKKVTVEEQKLIDKLPPDDDHKKRFIAHIIQSEQRRLDVLEFLKVGDMSKARTLMWKTIEIAYHEREAILEFTAAVGFGEGEGWERPDS